MKIIIRLLLIMLTLQGHAQISDFPYQREWATYFHADVFDSQGNAIVMGRTDHAFFNALLPYVSNPENTGVRFIAKLNANQTIGFVTKFGPSQIDNSSDLNHTVLTVDDNGNIYLCGYTKATDGISTIGAYQQNFHSNWSDPYDVYYPEADVTVTMPEYLCSDGFVMKFSPMGEKLWGTYFNGNKEVISLGMSANDDFLYLHGLTTSYLGIATADTYIPEWNDDIPTHQHRLFISKLNTQTGYPIWGTFTGSSNPSGYYAGTNFTVNSNGTVYSHANNQITAVSSSGQFMGNYVAAESSNDVLTMQRDEYGNFYVLGRTQSDAMGTSGTYKPEKTNPFEYFIAKYSEAGNKLWGTYLTGTVPVGSPTLGFYAYRFDIYVGFNTTEDGLATSGAFQLQNNGGLDAVFMKLAGVNGQLRWLSYYGGIGNETIINQIGFDQSENLYISGGGIEAGGILSPAEQIITQNALFATPFAPGSFGYVVKFSHAESLSLQYNTVSGMSLYPNPATSNITLQTKQEISLRATINIFDSIGRKIISTNATNTTFNIIDVSSLSSGIYIITIDDGDFRISKKFVKKEL